MLTRKTNTNSNVKTVNADNEDQSRLGYVGTTLAALLLSIGLLFAYNGVAPTSAQAHILTKQDVNRVVQQDVNRARSNGRRVTPGAIRRHRSRIIQRAIRHNDSHRCRVGTRRLHNNVRVKGQVANTHQRHVITEVLRNGRRMRASRKVLITAVATITQEATAHNRPHGHGTSVGAFQLINIHGSVAQRMDLRFSSNWFYRQAIGVDRRNPSMSINDIAQKVQKSAHPNAYGQWAPEATRTVNGFLGPCHR